ncbi:MAG: tetratricopeptide repeat protein, partial [Chloroflexi bacterium]|nr:tetratricopeptide repeat protein [Chloroflexota bacterium]
MTSRNGDSLLLLTKVQVPRRHPDTLRRPRLLEILHQNLYRKLTFVTAPAGYGKTTLLVDFAAEAPARVCWYHITPEDQDLGRFVRYLAWSLLQQYPHLEQPLQEVVEGASSQAPDVLAGALINIMAEQVDDFTLLVLDDYHLVGEHLPIVDFLETLLEHLPDQIRLLIASRSVYGIPAAKLFLRNELGVIGARELRFTAEELQALAQQAYGVTLPEMYAQDLAQRTDGWIIAMLLAVRLRTEGSLPLIHGAQEQLYTFLAEEVLHQLPAPLARFLLDSSIFTEFHADLCAEVLNVPAKAYLEEIEARNLFVTRIETPEGAVFRYHQLFAEFLRDRLQRETPDRYRRLHQRAATWFWEHDAAEEAVAHRLAAGDREGALPWMEQAARSMFISGRNDVLRYWVEVLSQPPDLRPKAPKLLLYHAKVLSNLNQFEESNALLNLARPALEKSGDTLALANLWITSGFNAHFRRQSDLALHAAQQALSLLNPEASGEEALYAAQAGRLEALGLFQTGEQDRAIARLETVISDLEKLHQRYPEMSKEVMYNLASALQDLGVFYFQAGRLSDVLRCFTRVYTLWREHQLNPTETPAILNNLAYLYDRMGQRQKALEIYEEALAVAHRHQSRSLAAILCGQGEMLYEEGDFDKARKVLEEAIEVAQRQQLIDPIENAHWSLAKLSASSGNFTEALDHLRAAAMAHSRPQTALWYRWREAYLYWLLGKEHTARRLFERILPRLNELQNEEQIRILLIQSSLLAYEGEKERSLNLLLNALELLSELGYMHFLRVEARKLSAFLQRANEEIKDPILEALLSLARTAAASLSRVKVSPPQPLRLEAFGFGVGRVLKNGETIPRSAWRAAGARALFFFILDKGKVRKEDLTLAFW